MYVWWFTRSTHYAWWNTSSFTLRIQHFSQVTTQSSTMVPATTFGLFQEARFDETRWYIPFIIHSITIFLWVFPWFSHGFPMVFLWFSYGFPMVFQMDPIVHHLYLAAWIPVTHSGGGDPCTEIRGWEVEYAWENLTHEKLVLGM